MAYATGSQIQVSIVPEVTPGTTPVTPVASVLRCTSVTLGMERNLIESAELRSDRMISDVRSGMRRIQGDIDAEFSAGTSDDLIEAACGGTWVPTRVLAGNPTLAVTASTRTITRSAGSFVTDTFSNGDWVFFSGFTNSGNNGIFKITTVAALTLILDATTTATLVDEVAATNKMIESFAGSLKSGTTARSFSIEVGLKNITQYRLFKGCYVDKMNFSVKPNAIAKMKYSILGMDEVVSATPMDATPDPALTTKTIDGNSALALIKDAGATLAYVTGVDFTLDNQGKILEVIGSNKGAGVNWGRSKITGTLTAYIPDVTLYNKFVNDTNSYLEFVLADGTVGQYSFKLPNVKYTAGKMDVTNEDAMTQSLPFTALYDPTTSSNIVVTRT